MCEYVCHFSPVVNSLFISPLKDLNTYQPLHFESNRLRRYTFGWKKIFFCKGLEIRIEKTLKIKFVLNIGKWDIAGKVIWTTFEKKYIIFDLLTESNENWGSFRYLELTHFPILRHFSEFGMSPNFVNEKFQFLVFF